MNQQTYDPIAAGDEMANARAPKVRPLYWSVRREIWENRLIHLAPLFMAAVALFAFSISILSLPKRVRAAAALPQGELDSVILTPYAMAPAPIMLFTFLVGLFYCLDALSAERRDRSILFWKSLPVSDRTTVLSKAAIPFVVLPLIAFVAGLLTQWLVLILSTAVLAASGLSVAPLWDGLRLLQEPLIQFYGISAHILWFAPIYAWFLLVSAWARRATLLWGVLPIVAALALERIAFGTRPIRSMLKYRLGGAMEEGFSVEKDLVVFGLAQLTPVRFLTSPGLWVGLLAAAAFLAAAIRVRRSREPA
jgi:ABC-2 type transport system permease protein